jgi:hypothetical protein
MKTTRFLAGHFCHAAKKSVEIVPHVVAQLYDYVKQKNWISSMEEFL